LGKQQDEILAAVQKSILELMESAGVLLFVVDAKAGVLEDDRRIAKMIQGQVHGQKAAP